MRRTMVAVAALAVVALPGCFFEHRRSDGHSSFGASVEVEHSYTYFPSQHAYYCESCDDWWVIEAGIWSHSRERPRNVVVRDDTPWLVVNVRDSEPHRWNDEHSRDYPSDWKSNDSKGPPPGRGWRK